MAADVRLILVLLLLASCTTAPEFHPQAWTRQAVPTLARLAFVGSGAGWNGGFVVVGHDRELVPVGFTSSDGVTWRELTADGFAPAVAAGHGDRAYVLGQRNGTPVVFSDGDWLALPGATDQDRLLSIAAGPRGVVVASCTEGFEGVRIWHAEGRTFDGPVTVPISGMTIPFGPRLVATPRGFFLAGVQIQLRTPPVLLESPDGRVWTETGAQLPDPPGEFAVEEVDVVQDNGSVTVVFTRPVIPGWPNNDSPGLTGWYRADGAWREITDVGNGRMPDAGVVANHERQIDDVLPWRNGFLAVGRSGPTASVWTSPDGVRWDKTPTRANGFDVNERLVPVTDGTKVLLFPSESADRIWVSASTR